MGVAGLELIKLSHISLDICLCCPSLEYIKMELHKFNSTKFLMNTQQPSKLNTKTKRNTNFSIPAFEVPLVLLMWLSGWCLKSVWTLPEGSFGCKRLFCMNDTYLQNHTNSVVLTQYHFNVKKAWRAFCWDTCFVAFALTDARTHCVFFAMCCLYSS